MQRWALAALLALCCLSAGEAMQCYYCPYGTCMFPTTVSCSFGQVCTKDTGTVSSSILGGLSLTAKGCLSIFSCLIPSSETIGGIDYSVSHSCCLTGLCNAATSARPSLLAGLVTLLAAVLMKFL